MKKAYESGEDVDKAFLHLRATAISGTSVSPAQLLFNRSIRTDLPAMTEAVTMKDWKRDELVYKQTKEKEYADRGSRHLPPLSQGETVRIQLGDKLVLGRVLEEISGVPRTFRVVTTDGHELRRNRLHLNQTLEKTPHVNITAHKEELAAAVREAVHRPVSDSKTSTSTRESTVQADTSSTSANDEREQGEITSMNPTASPTETAAPALRRSTRTRKAPLRYSP